jgi:uncharacterized membrane protein YcfT
VFKTILIYVHFLGVYLGFTTTLSLAVGLRLRRMAAEQQVFRAY